MNLEDKLKPKCLVIMAKEPQVGKVKTRLCPPLTRRQAAELYRSFLVDKIQSVRALTEKLGIDASIAFDPPDAEQYFERLASASLRLIPQTGKDLGERLANLFDELFNAGFHEVVVADSDSPTLPLDYLEKAFELLETADVVLGPADDGGYYLVGLNKPCPGLFRGIAWSTQTVLEQTISRAEYLCLKNNLLPRWYDVDTPPDLERLKEEIAKLDSPRQELIHATADFIKSLNKSR